MQFRNQKNKNLSHKLIEKWFLGEGNRSITYYIRNSGSPQFNKKSLPLAGFLTLAQNIPYQKEQLLEWFAILDNITYFSLKEPQEKLYFESFWADLAVLYKFACSIDDPDEVEPDFIAKVKSASNSFFGGSEVNFKGLMILLGRRKTITDIEDNKKGMTEVVYSCSDTFDGRFIPIFQTIIWYRNRIHGDSTKDIPETEKLSLPALSLHYNNSDTEDNDRARHFVEIVRLFLAGFLRIVFNNQEALIKALEVYEQREKGPTPGVGPQTNVNLDKVLNQYLDNVSGKAKRSIETQNKNLGGGTGNLIDICIQPALSNWQECGDEKEIHVSSLPDDARHRVFFLLGNPGAGKSTLMNQLVRIYTGRWKDKDTSQLPIVVSLHGKGGPGVSPDNTIREGFKSMLVGNLEETEAAVHLFDKMAEKGRLVLFLDGINEINVQESGEYLGSLVDLLMNKYGPCRVYLTDRLYEFQQHQDLFEEGIPENVAVFHLNPVSKDLILKYLSAIEIPETVIARFNDMIASPRVRALLGVPLNFRMLLQTVESTDARTKVNTRGELLEVFMRAVINDSRQIKQNYVDKSQFEFLQALSFALFQQGSSSISASSFLPMIGRQEIPPEFLARNILRINEGDDPHVEFVYDTYREFFLGRLMAEQAATNPTLFEDTWLTPQILADHNNKECFKLALEILLKNNRKDGIEAANQMVQAIFEKGRRQPVPLLDSTSLPPVNQDPHPYLGLLCNMVKDIHAGQGPSLRVAHQVLNELTLYRLNHPQPDDELLRRDKRCLANLLGNATSLNSPAIYAEVFNIYWTTLIGFIDRTEFGFQMANKIPVKPILDNIPDNPEGFFDALFDLYETLRVAQRKDSTSMITGFILLVFHSLKGRQYPADLLYRHIDRRRTAAANNYNAYNSLLLLQASMAAYSVPVEEFPRKARLEELKKRGIKLSWKQVNAIIQADAGRGENLCTPALELLCGDLMRSCMKYEPEMMQYILMTYLGRADGTVPPPIRNFLFQDPDQAIGILGSEGYLALLDMIRLPLIPREIVARFFDKDIADYLMNTPLPDQEAQQQEVEFLDGTPLDSRRFVPVECNGKIKGLPYMLLGRDARHAFLVTKQCQQQEGPLWIRISEETYPLASQKLLPEIVELEFATFLPATFEPFGTIGSSDGSELPYICVLQSQKSHVFRILNPDLVLLLREEETRKEFFAKEFRLARHILQLKRATILSADGLYSLWEIDAKSQKPIPRRDCFKMAGDAAFQSPRKAAFTSTMNTTVSLEGMEILTWCHGLAYLLCPKPSPALAKGLWLHGNNPEVYLPIHSNAKIVPWVLSIRFSCYRKLPASGAFKLPGGEDLFLFKEIPGEDSHHWHIFPGSGKIRQEVFLDRWKEAGCFHLEGIQEEVRYKPGTFEEWADRPVLLTAEAKDKACLESRHFTLESAHPCLTPVPVLEETDEGIHMHSIYYQSTTSPGLVRIATPSHMDKELWFSLDDGPRCRLSIPDSPQTEDGISCLYVRVALDNGIIPPIRQFGRMALFEGEGPEARPATVEYDTLLPAVALTLPRPEHLHASICRRLIMDLKHINLLNPTILKFFIEKSAVHSLLEEPVLSRQIFEKDYQEQYLNFCIIRSDISENARFAVYSPMYQKMLTPIPPTQIPEHGYILCEKDTHAFLLGMPPRKRVCGFLEGAILNKTGDDGFVTTQEDGDYYIPDCQYQIGTRISFFPAPNENYRRNSVNRFGKKVNPFMANDIVVLEEPDWGLCRCTGHRTSSDQNGHPWIELFLEGIGGSLAGEKGSVSFMIDSEKGKIMNSLPIGAELEAVILEGKWIIKA